MKTFQFENGETKQIKWLSPGSKYLEPVTITRKGDRLWFKFGFNKRIMADIKESLTGYKWHGHETVPVKQWSAKYCQHNLFQLAFFAQLNPYLLYDGPLPEFTPRRKTLMLHQLEIASQILYRRYSLIAAEMGTGKTLAAIEAMEASGIKDWLWVGPKAALYSVMVEFKKWQSTITPIFVTCSSLKKYIEDWPKGKPSHQGIIFDESSKYKTSTAQRTIAAQYLADAVRDEYGPDGIVSLLSGSPAPKSPADWYSQLEIAQPGFLKEGDIFKFKNRLAVIVDRENPITGGSFPSLVGWRDDEKKCDICGEMENSELHSDIFISLSTGHAYKPSRNEVAYLHQRMAGAVLVKFKKDCVDLPDKFFKIIRCTPSRELLRTAKLIATRTAGAAKVLTLLRELSDGFQYIEIPDGTETCECCGGNKTILQHVYIGPEIEPTSYNESIPGNVYPIDKYPQYWEEQKAACPNCDGIGETTKYIRSVKEIKCPKDNVLIDLLDEYEDVGRFVNYAGFTGSIDRCVNITKGQDWDWIRIDGRGWQSSLPDNPRPEELIDIFQHQQVEYPKISIIAHPASAGMGLTLTASPVEFYFSNDFNGESRIQSMDRIHRIGMDINKGATIIDVFNLPTDEYILNSVNKKLDLQSMSLGQINAVLEQSGENGDYYGV